MTRADDISDIALIRLFNEARKTMDLTAALRHVVERVRRYRAECLPQTIGPVVEELARGFGLDAGDLMGRRATTPYLEARRIAWYVLHHRFNVSFPDLAIAFGGRNHSTLIKVLAKFDSGDPDLQAVVDAIEAAVWNRLGRRAA